MCIPIRKSASPISPLPALPGRQSSTVQISEANLYTCIFGKLGRSRSTRSSPSPPPSGGNHVTIRRLTARNKSTAQTSEKPLDWSTSYQAGSSGFASSDSDNDTVDGYDFLHEISPAQKPSLSSQIEGTGSSSSVSTTLIPRPETPTRSRSPTVKNLDIPIKTPSRRAVSPSNYLQSMPMSFRVMPRTLLPPEVRISIRFPCAHNMWSFSADCRKATENIILLLSLSFGAYKLWSFSSANLWAATDIIVLIIASIIYLIWTQLSYFSLPKTRKSKRTDSVLLRHQKKASLRLESRDIRKRGSYPTKPDQCDDFGYVWMTVPKNYRTSLDDGVLTALLLGPLIACACLYTALKLPPPVTWLIEPPAVLDKSDPSVPAVDALVLSRRQLLQQTTVCSFILLMHLTASRKAEGLHRAQFSTPEGERGSVPRNELRRNFLYVVMAIVVSITFVVILSIFSYTGILIWQDMTYLDIATSSIFYQFCLFVAIRLAHKSFTLGELGLVSFGGTILFMEALHLTISRIWPVTTSFIKTYRLPTPLLILQLALIPGSLLVGFLLSPLLYLSRHIAQRPLRKLRFPEEKLVHLRALAAGFYAGSALITGGLIGLWARWCLGDRDPWLWVLFWILEGKSRWSRPLLLAYWAILASISVAGWNRQLARSRKYWPKVAHNTSISSVDSNKSPSITENHTPNNDSSVFSGSPNSLGLSFPVLPNLSNGTNVSNVATDLLDAADKRMPTLGLNARRKFFHLLAVFMFVPGIAYDPAFTHLSFSVAFALFTFTEYIRYFALYPFGATVHVFLTEFLDHKDSGTAILSHFYLLTGCAGSLWLEGSSRLLAFTGTLVLGVGDAVASVVGKRIGRTRWSTSSPKTFEGSAAFAVSVIGCAWLLRVLGLVESFSTFKYAAAVCVAAALEAFSLQNDNLTLPLFLWSLLALMDV